MALQGEAAKPQAGVVVKEMFMVVEYSTAFLFLKSYNAQPQECVGRHAHAMLGNCWQSYSAWRWV